MTGEDLQGNSPNGAIGVNVYSYDTANDLFETNCISGVAPLERIGLAVSLDKSSHTESMHLFGRTGNFDSAFIGVSMLLTNALPTEEDVAQLATPVPESTITDEADTISVNIVYRVPESKANSTFYISFAFKFAYEIPASDTITGYVIVPFSITVNPFDDLALNNKIDLVSIEDQDGNDVSTAVCLDGRTPPETITYVFSFDDANPENYAFIPVVSQEVPGDNKWQERNSYVNTNLAQLESAYILSSSDDFTGGQAQVVLDAAMFQVGDYCVGAIAKFKNVQPPVISNCPTFDVDITVAYAYWTEYGFNLIIDIDFNIPTGYSISKPMVLLTVKHSSATDPYTYLETEIEGVGGLVGSITNQEILVVDNDPSKGKLRVNSTNYSLLFNFELLATETATGETCTFLPDAPNLEILVPTPAETDNLINHNGTIGPTNFVLRAI